MAPATRGGRPGRRTGRKRSHANAQKRDGVALLPNDAVAAFHDAGAADVAKNLFGIRAGEGVARDFFAALDAFEQEGIACALRDAQIGADRRQQVGRKHIENRNQVALLCEPLEFAEVRLDHRGLREPRRFHAKLRRAKPRARPGA